ncbi:hypothetical protein L1987_60504 [Smallanthus sonchifolius]|uniref:Uncharacterized protein n=1 Tax=Smallanthus sonchifolius TaxID=185202 RepID=A0ACB9D855_9ASTR|nr:hypothetical protein L1987_60504 [Smallanthus sonchifolius]
MSLKACLVPITRAFLSSYYDKHQFPPISDDVARLSEQLYSFSADLQDATIPLPQGERYLLEEVESQPPHKIDENMWKNREQIEEIIFLLENSHWPKLLQQQSTPEDVELARLLKQLREKCARLLKIVILPVQEFRTRVQHSYDLYAQDFRGALIRKQRQRSEKNKKAQVDALINSGGSIRDRYALLWQHQMERRRQLAQLGSA